jgi:hypothetical protein
MKGFRAQRLHATIRGRVVVLDLLYFLNPSYNVLFSPDFVLYTYIFRKNEDFFDKTYISLKNELCIAVNVAKNLYKKTYRWLTAYIYTAGFFFYEGDMIQL